MGNNVGGIAELRAKVQEQEQSIRTVLGSGSAGGTDIIQKCQALEIKTSTYEGIVTTLHKTRSFSH
jgi:hypothetical protein